MWLCGFENDGLPPIRPYDYQPSRGGYHAEEFLKGFCGYLACDGFSGYNKLKNVIGYGCLAHMRWYWHEALLGKPKKAKEKTPAEMPDQIPKLKLEHFTSTIVEYLAKR